MQEKATLHSWTRLVASVALIVAFAGCTDDAELLFIEPHGSTGETSLWLTALGGSQSGGGRRLDEIYADVAEVRYNVRPRQSAFLFRHEIDDDPARLIEDDFELASVQLPAVVAGAEERTEWVGSVVIDNQLWPDRWNSFRVYDQGMCSVLTGWPSLTESLYDGIVAQIDDTDGVKGISLRWGELWFEPRSEYPSYQASDTDHVRMRFRIAADAMTLREDGRILGCNDVRVTLDLEARLHATDFAWSEVESDDLVTSCVGERSWDEIDVCADLSVPIFCDVVLWRLLAEESWTTWRTHCDDDAAVSLPHLGEVPLTDVDAVRLRRDFSGVDGDSVALVGVRDLVREESENPNSAPELVTHDLGAHDPLTEMLAFEVSDLDTRRCTRWARDAVRSSLRKGLSQGLVVGLAGALRDQLVLDPYLLGQDDQPCVSDSDCDASGDGGPAFRDGTAWRGARHECRVRDRDALRETIDPFPLNGAQDGSFCFVGAELDRLNVRPDGAEVVLLDDVDTDPQGNMFESTVGRTNYVNLGYCDVDGDGSLVLGPRDGYLRDSSGPQRRFLQLPIRVEPE